MLDRTDRARGYLAYQAAGAAWPIGQMTTEAAAVSSVSMGGGLHPDLIAESLERALRIDPNSPNLWFHLAIQDMARGEWLLVKRDLEMFERVAQPQDIARLKAIYFSALPTPL